MKREEIMKYIDNLSWNKNEEVQLEAISRLEQIDEDSLSLLIQPSKKLTWGNAVIVIKNIGFPKNKSIIPNLIELLQDMNWPGAKIGIDVLADMDVDIVIPHIESALKRAAEEKDYMWIGGIQRLIDRLKLNSDNFSKTDVFKLLKLADW